jgi:hypothetical protein
MARGWAGLIALAPASTKDSPDGVTGQLTLRKTFI